MAVCQVLGIQDTKALNSAMASHDWLCLVMADHGRLLLAKRAMASLCWPLLAMVGHVVRLAKSMKWMERILICKKGPLCEYKYLIRWKNYQQEDDTW